MRAPKALNGLAAMYAALVAYLSSFALFIPLSLPKEIQSLVACRSTSSISTQETRGVPVRWSAWGTKPCVSRACPRCAQIFQLIWSHRLYLPTQNLCQNQRTLNNLWDVRNSYIALENILHSMRQARFYYFIFTSTILVLQGLPLRDLPFLFQWRIPRLTHLHKTYVMHWNIKYK